MRSRRFGVEIEFGYKPGLQPAKAMLKSGVDRGLFSNHWYRYAVKDGTTCETKSPILQGPEGFKELRSVMEWILENEGYTSKFDGLHVHHDAPDFKNDVKLIKQLVQSWVANREYIGMFVASRRNATDVCGQWTETMVKTVVNATSSSHLYAPSSRDLNISKLAYMGTIELRLHEGTLDFPQAEAWIRFGQAFLNKVAELKNPIPDLADRETLLKRINVSRQAQERLLERAALQHFSPKEKGITTAELTTQYNRIN